MEAINYQAFNSRRHETLSVPAIADHAEVYLLIEPAERVSRRVPKGKICPQELSKYTEMFCTVEDTCGESPAVSLVGYYRAF